MEKLLGLFPNIILEESCIHWGIKLNKLESSMVAVLSYKDDDDKKSANRRLKILRSHLMAAAHIAGKNPLQSCKMVLLKDEEDMIATNLEEDKVSFTILLSHIPDDLEKTAITVSWFAQYLEQPMEEERARVFRLYNALGTLPGGFESISSVSPKQEDINVLTRLLLRVEDFHEADGEDESYVYKTRELSYEELKGLEDCYLKALASM